MLLPRFNLQEKVYFYIINKNKEENIIESYTIYEGVINAINIKKNKETNIFILEYTITNYSGCNYREDIQIFCTEKEAFEKIEELLDNQ